MEPLPHSSRGNSCRRAFRAGRGCSKYPTTPVRRPVRTARRTAPPVRWRSAPGRAGPTPSRSICHPMRCIGGRVPCRTLSLDPEAGRRTPRPRHPNAHPARTGRAVPGRRSEGRAMWSGRHRHAECEMHTSPMAHGDPQPQRLPRALRHRAHVPVGAGPSGMHGAAHGRARAVVTSPSWSICSITDRNARSSSVAARVESLAGAGRRRGFRRAHLNVVVDQSLAGPTMQHPLMGDMQRMQRRDRDRSHPEPA